MKLNSFLMEACKQSIPTYTSISPVHLCDQLKIEPKMYVPKKSLEEEQKVKTATSLQVLGHKQNED